MRLIDADELKKALAEMWYESAISITGVSVSELIDQAPTIEPIENIKSCGVIEEEQNALPSAEPKWITDRKPTEDGKYIVTLDAFGHHRFIVLMHYGKPLMPNREVKGMCWYMSDSEWGDVVYDDDEILAWLPLPKPYGESEVEE